MNMDQLDIIDLHTHSRMSDGTDSPVSIIRQAKESGLRGVALTDHDSIGGNGQARRLAQELEIEFLSGIEIGCKNTFGNLHILGYFTELDEEALNRELKWIKEARTERNRSILERLASHDMDLSMADLNASAGDDTIGRLHIAKLMKEKGCVNSMKEAFEHINHGCCCFVPRETLSAEKAIELIRDHGGISSMAHPFLIPGQNETLRKILDAIVGYGIDAIEVYYIEHTQENTELLEKMSGERSLMSSGGTDYHGDNKPGVRLGLGRGDMRIPYHLMEKILRKLP